jgi:hypothetical protein
MFASKSDYRSYFANVSVWIKMNYFLKLAGVNQSSFSRFMKDQKFEYMVSLQKLERLYQEISSKIT